MRDKIVNYLFRLPRGLARRLRRLWLTFLGVHLSGCCWIERISIPRNPWDISIDASALDDFVVLLSSGNRQESKRIVIKCGTYINRFTTIDACEKIEIGRNCMIGPYCYFTDHDHDTKRDMLIKEQKLVSKPVIIEDDVWIGAGSIILKGVTIGKGAVIGAGSVVTHNVSPYDIAYGSPAQKKGERS